MTHATSFQAPRTPNPVFSQLFLSLVDKFGLVASLASGGLASVVILDIEL
jgi:hypothetical protein